MRFLNGDFSIKIISVALGMIIIGAVMFVTGLGDSRVMSQTPVNIYEVEDWSTLEAGTHVTFDLKMVWDEFYSAVEESRTMGIKTSERETGRGYMIPQIVYNSTSGEYEISCFIGTEVSDYATFNQMIAELTEWYEVWLYQPANPDDYCKTTYKIDGKLRKMTKEEENLMKQYLVSAGMTTGEAEAYCVPLMVQRMKVTSTPIVVGIILVILGAVVLAAYIIVKKKNDTKDYYGVSTASSMSSTSDGSQYYGPEGLASEAQKTYQYGGTNTYGTSDVYSSSYTGSGSEVDSSTGLSSDFLQREQQARAEREREEANQRAMAANAAVYAGNPLFGNDPAKAPMPASQSFSAYNQVVNPAAKNQNNAANNTYGGAQAQQPFTPAPPVQEAYLGGTPVQPTYSQPTYSQQQFTPAPPVQETYLGSTPVQPTYSQVPPVQEPYLGGSPAAPQQTAYSPMQPVMPQTPPDGSAPVQLPSGNGQYADNPGNKNYL